MRREQLLVILVHPALSSVVPRDDTHFGRSALYCKPITEGLVSAGWGHRLPPHLSPASSRVRTGALVLFSVQWVSVLLSLAFIVEGAV